VPRPLSISDPIRLRFDDFELDEANAWLLRYLGERPLASCRYRPWAAGHRM